MATRNVYVAGGNGIGYTYEVDSPADYSSIPNTSYFKDLSLGVGGMILYKDSTGQVIEIYGSLAGKQDTLVSGVNIKTVNGITILGSGNVSTYSNTGNVLYVATTGSDTFPDATRISHLGSINVPFLTLDAASAVAVAGDLIHVFPGAYTATGNIAKSGVNWHFENGVTVTKTTSGELFNTTGHTVGFNISGKARFIKTTNSGELFYFAAASLEYNIECLSVKSSVVGSPIFTITGGGLSLYMKIDYANHSGSHILNLAYGGNGCWIDIKAVSWQSTAAQVIHGGWWYNTTLNITALYFGSTTSTTIEKYNLNCHINLNIDRIEGVTYALESNDGYYKLVNVNCSYMSGINDVGDSNKYYVSGHCKTYTGSVNIYLKSCNQINIQGGYFKGNFDMGIEGNSNNLYIVQSNGYSDITIGSYTYSVVFNLSGGIMNLRGNLASNQVSTNGSRLISGGTLNLYDKFVHGYNPDPSYSGYAGLSLTSGTLRVFGGIHNQANDPKGVGIDWSGGNLIFENATIVTSNQYAHAVRSITAGLVMKVTGRISTNRVERDALLGGKYQIYKWQVNSVAVSQAYINGGFAQESDITTYNTQAKLAERLVVLLNASFAGIVAYQDNPGVDTIFYVRSSTKGGTFTVGNGLNTTASLFQLTSFPMDANGPGVLLCDSNVTF
jgi:hypothetical protein